MKVINVNEMTDTDKIITLTDLKKVELQAAEWIMRLEDDDASSADVSAFHAWYNESDRNRKAFASLGGLWDDFDIVEELNDYMESDDNVILMEKDSHGSFLSWRNVASIAAALVFIMAGLGLFQLFGISEELYDGTYLTSVGEQKTINLPDGSTIVLNTNSKVDIAYTKTARNIYLMQGEAYFDVASNKKKPFSVYVGKGIVTAVGTAFSVQLINNKIDVLVVEGRVALANRFEQPDASEQILPKPVLEVTAGQQVTFDKKIENLGHVESDELIRKLSWREGMLGFTGQPLSEVIHEISRYTDIDIMIESDELRNLPIAGYFKVGEVEALFEALEIMANIHVERLSVKQVKLSIGKNKI